MKVNNEGLNVAVWGLGRHAINHVLPAISACSGLDVEGVLSRDSDVVLKVCEAYRCRTWASANEMLSDPSIDVIYVATPTGLHYEHGLKVLRSNKHLWCEKTLTTGLRKSESLVNLGRERGLSVCEGFMYLYHPQFIQLKDLVNNNDIGDIKSVSCRFGLPELDQPGFRFIKRMGGSCILDVGSYPISAMQSLFTPTQTKIIAARSSYSAGGVDVEGFALLQLDATIYCHLQWGYSRAYINDIDIWGSKGSVYSDKIFSKNDDYKATLNIRSIRGDTRYLDVDQIGHFGLMLSYFAQCIKSKELRENEYDRILSLAVTLQQIGDFTTSNSSSNIEV